MSTRMAVEVLKHVYIDYEGCVGCSACPKKRKRRDCDRGCIEAALKRVLDLIDRLPENVRKQFYLGTGNGKDI